MSKMMKLARWLCCLHWLLPVSASAQTWQGEVIKVLDGDTLHVRKGREIIKVRLYGIDCPEKRQSFGPQATQFTQQFILRTKAKVETVDIDRYGRTVGLVSSGRKLLNRELVRAGYAWTYPAYCKKQPLCNELHELQEKARKRKAGLWQERKPLPPWEWRKRNRR
jgi:endonuclease YncB( thermonuclease family)